MMGLAVIPEAEMEIGHTHIYLLTTRACKRVKSGVSEVSDACYPECFWQAWAVRKNKAMLRDY